MTTIAAQATACDQASLATWYKVAVSESADIGLSPGSLAEIGLE